MRRSRERLPVCRCLFGRPDQGEVDQFLQECEKSLECQYDEATRRWNFDFRKGCPLPDTDGKTHHYEWTPISVHDPIPPVYKRMIKFTSQVGEESPAVTESANVAASSDGTVSPENNAAELCHSSLDAGTTDATPLAAVDLEDNPPTNSESTDRRSSLGSAN